MTPATDSNRNPELLAAAHWASSYAADGEHGYALCVVLSYLGQRYEAARRAIDREKTRADRAENEVASLRSRMNSSGNNEYARVPEGVITVGEAAKIARLKFETMRSRIKQSGLEPTNVVFGINFYRKIDLRPLMGPVKERKQRRQS